jgi:hypothetical protein
MVDLVKGLFFKRFLRLHICDAVWSRLVALHFVHSIHCLWGGF